jgi:hypothetical protein
VGKGLGILRALTSGIDHSPVEDGPLNSRTLIVKNLDLKVR